MSETLATGFEGLVISQGRSSGGIPKFPWGFEGLLVDYHYIEPRSGYKMGFIYLQDFGVIPAQAPGSNLAIMGAWDMPTRLGKTKHSWGDEQGVEPYVSASEIRHGGRDLIFHGLVKGQDKSEGIQLVNNLISHIDSYSDLMTFSNEKFGSWEVYVNGEVKAECLQGGWFRVEVPFREPVVPNIGTVPAPDGGEGFDQISFKSLGITKLRVRNEYSRPAPKEPNFVAYQNEGYQITKASERVLTLEGVMIHPDYDTLAARIASLQALMASPGTKLIDLSETDVREVFNEEGFKITDVKVSSNQATAFLSLPLTEVNYTRVIDFIQEVDGDYLLTVDNQKIRTL